MNDVDAFLEHHGIKGQRWGIRRQLQEHRDRKAQKFINKAAGIHNQIDVLSKSKVKRASVKGVVNSIKLKDLREDEQRALKNAERAHQGKLTSRQRKILIGAAVVAVPLAAYGAYTMTQSGETRRLITKGADFVKSKFNPTDPGWKLDRSLANSNMNVEDISKKVVSAINPGYGDVGTKVNCRRATFAYEMRRRGYDVAATKTTDGRGQGPVGMFNALFSKQKDIVPENPFSIGAKVASETNKDSKPFTEFIESFEPGKAGEINPDTPGGFWSELRKQPEHARGELGMFWGGGGGHSMAWEIVDGKPVIFDTQSGHIYKTVEEFDEIGKHAASIGITRLDNKPLNTNFLLRWVKNND